MKIKWVSKEEANIAVGGEVIQTEIVLDVGPGIQPQAYFQPRIHICVEPYLPYIERLRQNTSDDSSYVFLNCTWDVAMTILPDKSVDSIFALDVLEHLEKEEGRQFLERAEKIARRQIVIFTPFGFYPQAYDDPSEKHDRWGMEGGYWQTHRSGWRPEDFGKGWEFVCCEAYHFIDQNEQPLEKPFGAIWAFRNLETTKGKTMAYSDRNEASLTSKGIYFIRHVLKRVKARL